MRVLYLESNLRENTSNVRIRDEIVRRGGDLAIRELTPDQSHFVPPDEPVDVVVNRTNCANPDYTLALDRWIRTTGVPITNPIEPVREARDKTTYPARYGAHTPPTSVACSVQCVLACRDTYGGELVVKHPLGAQSQQVARVRDLRDAPVIEELLGEPPGQVIVQPYYSGFTRGDKRIIVQRDRDGRHRVTGAYARVPAPGGWKTGYYVGGRIRQTSLSQRESTLAQWAARRSGLDSVGFDIGDHDGRTYIIESNSPTGGFTEADDRFGYRSVSAFVNFVAHLASHGRRYLGNNRGPRHIRMRIRRRRAGRKP